MTEEKVSLLAKEFSDTGKSEAKLNKSSHVVKIKVIGALAAVLLLGVVLSLVLFFAVKKTTSNRLVDITLEEGETLTYRVDQDIEIQVGEIQKGTVRATVTIRVLNKTSEEYWLLMKFNVSHVGGNVNITGVQMMVDYFLVRLQLDSRTTNSRAGESFEIYGSNSTNEEQLRLVFSILQQLLPNVKRDLYEDVNGKKVTGSKPEESPLLPGPVKMHREANTSNKEAILIKNHFDRNDFANLSSEIDLNLTYSDFASINKSNGMVSESLAYFSEQLNIGEPIQTQGGFDVTMMKVTVKSQVSLIETHPFGYAELEAFSLHLFVRLIVPKSAATLSVEEKPAEEVSGVSNLFPTPSNFSLSNRQHNSTNSSFATPLRFRRASQNRVVDQVWRKASSTYPRVNLPIKLFEKKVVGIRVKGTAYVSLKNQHRQGLEIEVKVKISVGGRSLTVFYKKYKSNELRRGIETLRQYQWNPKIGISIPVFFLRLGVDFSLKVKFQHQLRFPSAGNSLNPPKLIVQFEPSSEVSASITGYISAYLLRGGAYGDGTLLRVNLPVTLSYQATRPPGKRWCLDLSARLTALQVRAGIFYQWRRWTWRGLRWGKRRTLIGFGRSSGITWNGRLLNKCTGM